MSVVPQGSVLGPILFVLYNDLPDIVKSTSKLFADDTKLYNKVLKESNGGNIIQQDLHTLEKWSDTWLLRFNASKCNCKCMHMGKDNPLRSYILNGVEIQEK